MPSAATPLDTMSLRLVKAADESSTQMMRCERIHVLVGGAKEAPALQDQSSVRAFRIGHQAQHVRNDYDRSRTRSLCLDVRHGGCEGTPHMMEGMLRSLIVKQTRNAAIMPKADVALSLADYSFILPTPLIAGIHLIDVRNAGF
jgi:hypothetical protein